MKRLVLLGVVVTMLFVGGCVDGTGQDEGAVSSDGTDELVDPDAAGEPANSETEDEPTATDGGDESTAPPADSETGVDGELEIHHIDVGQADATLLIEPSGETMLVDSGDWRDGGDGVIAYLEAQDVDRIDHLVATHAHADHIGGHDTIIEHYETNREGVDTAYDSGVAHTSQTYDRYLDAVEAHDIDLLVVEDGDSFAFGEAAVDIYNPPAEESGTDLHYNSVALAFEFGEFTYLTTGDAEADAEHRMIDEHDDLEAKAYQAGHHGSSTSSTESFLEHVSPAAVVVSSDHDSQYGHPHDEVLERFTDRGVETYWTGVHGDVVVRTDGQEYGIETEREFSTDPMALLEAKPAVENDTQESISPSIDHTERTALRT
ncbi:MBL fold metallo-hydrolase [Salinadaptatus halalkaliphilus]|uniref:MBL fold metallo-hydrolase n=1 Tax=Salinadaptatus halalkaliphilus TaxID=2419781 RepID=A0A4S3TPL3_9EURY|nr:ComEC/Rec2 family competence protein [Salinadaptatus halalkaliphilus]THE66251.1 MBL fold metallo-hydrolase [Salinadaptatus halalkaliphilus]